MCFATNKSCLSQSKTGSHGWIALEREHVEHRSRLHPFQLRRGIDEPLVPGAALPDQDRNILLAVDREGHRRSVDAATRVELPELLQRLAVKCRHLARGLTGEHQI